MKRVWTAGILLLFIFLFSIASWLWLGCVLTQMEQSISDIVVYTDSQNYTEAQNSARKLSAYYKEKAPVMALFIKQDVLATTANTLSGLAAYAVENSEPDLYCEADKATAQLQALRLSFAL